VRYRQVYARYTAKLRKLPRSASAARNRLKKGLRELANLYSQALQRTTSCKESDIEAVEVGGVPATIIHASPAQLVVRTEKATEPHRGFIKVISRVSGTTRSLRRLYEYNQLPQILEVTPTSGSAQGNEVITLHGSRMCEGSCDDLVSLRIGDASVTHFIHKSPSRVMFRSPPMAATPGHDLRQTIVLESAVYGRAIAPDAFLFLKKGLRLRVDRTDMRLMGGYNVEIHGENALGGAAPEKVLLAGVPAKIISMTPGKMTIQAGDAAKYCASRGAKCSKGLQGSIVLQGNGASKETGLSFKYNPPCRIHHIVPSTDGSRIRLYGRYLGYGDEFVTVNGESATVLARHRRSGAMVTRLSVALKAPTALSQLHLTLTSRRSGSCSWQQSSQNSLTGLNKQLSASHSQATKQGKPLSTKLKKLKPKPIPASQLAKLFPPRKPAATLAAPVAAPAASPPATYGHPEPPRKPSAVALSDVPARKPAGTYGGSEVLLQEASSSTEERAVEPLKASNEVAELVAEAAAGSHSDSEHKMMEDPLFDI